MMDAHINPAHVVLGEMQNVLAAMRLNRRWASGNSAAFAESPLLKSLKSLMEMLHGATNLKTMDTMAYISPFLEVIRSEETSGPITGVALTSVQKFLNNILRTDYPNAQRVIGSIAEAATHCRFEATDPESDEVVLLKILQVILACVTSNTGMLLNEDAVIEMIQTCYRMTIQPRLSELLRKNAESTLVEMVLHIFRRFNLSKSEDSLSPLTPNTPRISTSTDSANLLKEMDAGRRSPINSPQVHPEAHADDESSDVRPDGPSVMFVNPQGIRFEAVGDASGGSETDGTPSAAGVRGVPYGSSCLARIFKFLAGIIDSNNKENPEEVLSLGLSLLNNIVEQRGSQLISTFPEIRSITQNAVCKHLLFNMHTRSLPVFTLTLRLFTNLYLCGRAYLKEQLEAFFTSLLLRATDNKGSLYEQQELAAECLVEFCRLPSLTDLFINYDCDIYCSNLFDNLCKSLYKSAYPTAGPLQSIHLLSMDAMLSIVHTIANRSSNSSNSLISQQNSKFPSADALRKKKQTKVLLATAAEHFNKGPKESYEFLKAHTLIESTTDWRGIARFLRDTPRLDKGLVGELIGKKTNVELLKEFVKTFDFGNHKFHQLMRQFLESFRIPGEAPIISHIFENFSDSIFEALSNRSDFLNRDAVFVFLYSALMLNTDLHKKTVKNKMTLEDFIKNNRSINNGQDLPKELVVETYQAIKSVEIQIPEEFPSGEATESSWSDLAKRAASSRHVDFISAASADYDRDVFSANWGPIVAAIYAVFETAEDEAVIAKTIEGLTVCAQIAATYNLSDVFDNLVITLCKFSSLLSISDTNAVMTFGRDQKSQLATIAVFTITRKHSDHLREGWRNVLNCMLSLYKMGLLTTLTDLMVDFAPVGVTQQPAPRERKPVQHSSLLSPFGLLGTAGWFGGGEPLDSGPSEEEKRVEETAKDVIAKADIRGIVEHCGELQADSLVYLAKALILASVRPKKRSVQAERAAMFSLDLLCHITLINQNRIIYLWVLVYDHLMSVINAYTAHSPLFEKAVLCILVLCINLFHRSEIMEQLVRALSVISKLDKKMLDPFADKLMFGFMKLTERHAAIIGSSSVSWEPVLDLISQFAHHPAASTQAFKVYCTLVSYASFLSSDNFNATLDVLLKFIEAPNTLAPQAMVQLFYQYTRVLEMLGLSSESLSASAPNRTTETLEAPGSPLSVSTPGMESLKEPGAVRSQSSQDFAAKRSLRKRDEKKKEAWSKFWRPVLQQFCKLTRDPRPDVRNNAMTHLQKALLSPDLDILTSEAWFGCFEEVLFPFLTDLLQPCPGVDPSSMEEIRLRGSSLLSKIFLRNLTTIVEYEDFHILWLKILQFVEMYFKADNTELLAESITESLKNMLLVMSASGIFKPGHLTHGHDIWALSWQAINSFCDALKVDVLAKVEPVLGPVTPPAPEVAVADASAPQNPSTTQPTDTISSQQQQQPPSDSTPAASEIPQTSQPQDQTPLSPSPVPVPAPTSPLALPTQHVTSPIVQQQQPQQLQQPQQQYFSPQQSNEHQQHSEEEGQIPFMFQSDSSEPFLSLPEFLPNLHDGVTGVSQT